MSLSSTLAGGRADQVEVATLSLVDTLSSVDGTAPGFGLRPLGRLPGPLSDSGVAVAGRTAYLIGGEVKGDADPQTTIYTITL